MRMRGMWDNPTPTGLGSGGPGRRSEPCPGVRPGDWDRNAECGTQERCQEHGICSQDTGWGQHSLGLDSEPEVKGPQGMARLPQLPTLGFVGLVGSRPCGPVQQVLLSDSAQAWGTRPGHTETGLACGAGAVGGGVQTQGLPQGQAHSGSWAPGWAGKGGSRPCPTPGTSIRCENLLGVPGDQSPQ